MYVCTTPKCGATPRDDNVKDNTCPRCKQLFTEAAVPKKNVAAAKSAVGSPPKDLDEGDAVVKQQQPPITTFVNVVEKERADYIVKLLTSGPVLVYCGQELTE